MIRRLALGAALPVGLGLFAARLLWISGLAEQRRPSGLLDWFCTMAGGPLLVGAGLGASLVLLRCFGRWGLAISQLGWALMGLHGVVAQAFAATTGSPLPGSVVAYALRHAGEVLVILQSELNAERIVGLVGLTLLPLTLPHLLPERWVRGPAPARPVALGLLMMALGLFMSALLPWGARDRELATEPLWALWEGSPPEAAPAGPPPPSADARAALRDPAAPRRNLLVILLESTGYDATSLSPRGPATTPFLAALARENTELVAAQVPLPHTSKALVSTLCGVYPAPTTRLPELDWIPSPCLAGLLGPLGYDNAYVQVASGRFESRYQLIDRMGFSRFVTGDMMDATGFAPANYFGVEDRVALGPIAALLDRPRQGPFFLALLTNAAHHDYLRLPGHPQQEFDPAYEAHDRYLNAVAYVDGFLRALFDLLRERGLDQNTVVMVLGDHGEGFGEHGRNEHDNVPYSEALHIPFVIVDPGRPPQRIERPVSQVDLLPTALDLLGVDLVSGAMPGVSVFSPDLDPNRPLFFHCWYERRCAGMRQGDWRYVHRFGWSSDERYNLLADPAERHNQIDEVGFDRAAAEAAVTGHWAQISAAYPQGAAPTAPRR